MIFLQIFMKRLIFFLLCLLTALPAFAQQPELSLAAKSFVLSDFHSGQVLASHNPHERLDPASLTKLMTAYVAFSAIKQERIALDQVVPVSKKSWRMVGSRMFIEPNKRVTVNELIRGMIVQSGNDACVALAELIAGSEDMFAHMMNEEAKRLKMHNTHFTNSTGLTHPEHYSTAHDLTLLASAIIRDFPEFYPLYSLKEYTYNGITQPNRNRLLWTDPNVDGMKTGWTEAAGYCLITSAQRDHRRLISVVMGTASPNARSIESQRLLNYGFQFFDTAHPYKKHQTVANVQLWKGAQNKLKVGFDRDIYFSLPRGKVDKLKARMEYRQPLVAPIGQGQEIGAVRFVLDGQEIASYPLISLETVEAAGFLGRAWDNLKMWLN
ncbi:D-alanyl-D-alanine carboxypeptidase (penicillin-binding protein 5/6) [Nitrosomonas halophila]|uniref:serine-type D-Ala-D-Ala carboxypeptidase n=2 Tax=Nitrosomonas halophila TaxID=44576 RepID=A0A1H3FLM0_9PROT|nr:D-alanyl-D-alanine carboxypeptidase (penicillin-binding protein 5/6) [Nitrosomonas halophila]